MNELGNEFSSGFFFFYIDSKAECIKGKDFFFQHAANAVAAIADERKRSSVYWIMLLWREKLK